MATFPSGKPSECQDRRQSQAGHSAMGLFRMVSSPKYVISNSPYVSSRSTIAFILRSASHRVRLTKKQSYILVVCCMSRAKSVVTSASSPSNTRGLYCCTSAEHFHSQLVGSLRWIYQPCLIIPRHLCTFMGLECAFLSMAQIPMCILGSEASWSPSQGSCKMQLQCEGGCRAGAGIFKVPRSFTLR